MVLNKNKKTQHNLIGIAVIIFLVLIGIIIILTQYVKQSEEKENPSVDYMADVLGQHLLTSLSPTHVKGCKGVMYSDAIHYCFPDNEQLRCPGDIIIGRSCDVVVNITNFVIDQTLNKYKYNYYLTIYDINNHSHNYVFNRSCWPDKQHGKTSVLLLDGKNTKVKLEIFFCD